MSDDTTRELPPVPPEGEPEATRDEAGAPTSPTEPVEGTAVHDEAAAAIDADAEPQTTNEEIDTVTDEQPAETTPTTEVPRPHEPLSSPEEPTTELSLTAEPSPPDEPTTEVPRAAEPTATTSAFDESTTELPRPVEPTPTPLPPIAPVPVASTAQARYAPPATEPATGHIRVMSPTTPPAPPAPEPRKTLRVGTVVWGLVVAAVGVGLLSIAWGAHLDAELALIVLLGAAGLALLVGSLVGMRRSRNRLEGRG